MGFALFWPAMSGAEPCTGSNMEGELADGVNVAAGRVADTAGNRAGQVSDDVAEEVIGHDHVEAGGIGDHEDGGRVNVQVVGLDLGEFGRDFGEVAVVEAAGVGEHVGLVHEGDLLAAGGGKLESVADQALHSVCGVEGDLGSDFVRGALANHSAVADVGAFGALTHDYEVDVAGVGKRGDCAGVQAGGAQVDVVVEGEAQLQEHFAFDEAGRNLTTTRVCTDSAEEDRVVLFEGFHSGVGQGFAGFQPVLGAELVVGGVDGDVFELAGAGEDALGFGNDFGADAVAGDDGEVDAYVLQSCLSTVVRAAGQAVGCAGGFSDSGLDMLGIRRYLVAAAPTPLPYPSGSARHPIGSGMPSLCRLKQCSPAESSAGEHCYEFSRRVRDLKVYAITRCACRG